VCIPFSLFFPRLESILNWSWSGSIKWFAPLLAAIAHTSLGIVQVRVQVHVTCLCKPEDIPDIPGMEVRVGGRPDMKALLAGIAGIEGGDAEGPVEAAECCGCGCVDEALRAREKGKEKPSVGGGADAEKAAGQSPFAGE